MQMPVQIMWERPQMAKAFVLAFHAGVWPGEIAACGWDNGNASPPTGPA